MSGNVRIKEEPEDFECSPFEILNELAAGDHYGDHYGDEGGDQMIIKHETQVAVKTEVTIGAQYDEDCSVLEAPHDPNNTSHDHDNTSRDHDNTSAHDNSYHENAGTIPEVEESVTDPANLSLKMELPAKYKTLFDGVKAFPEMSREILPIIEELVHFHNCICLLRRDLNMVRCEDCGRGFANSGRVKIHARHCVVQKLENRFTPANIRKHTGPSLETETLSKETETEILSKETETETVSKETSKESDSCPNTTSRDKDDPDYIPDRNIKVEPGLSFRVTTDPVSGALSIDRQSPQSAKRRRVRRVKEDREFEKGTCWGVPTKTEACKIPKVVELNQFNHKMINPYHLFRYTGEVLYHSPMPLPISFSNAGTAQNVFDTMISSIVEVGRLVPMIKGRKKYVQILQKQKRIPLPDLELLPTPQKGKSQSTSSSTPEHTYSKPQNRSKAKKIKIVVPSLPGFNPDDFLVRPPPVTSLNATNIGSRRTKMFNQSAGPIKKKIVHGLNYEIIQKGAGKSLIGLKSVISLKGKEKATEAVVNEENMTQKGTFDFEPPSIGETSSSGNYNSDAQRDYLKFKIWGYMQEDFYETRYCLEEHTVLFLKHFMGNTFANRPTVRQRAEKILKALQDTIPDDPIKADAVKDTRSKFARIMDEVNYEKVYRLDLNTAQFIEDFTFGVANPCQKDVEHAMEILNMIEIQKIRFQLHAEMLRTGSEVVQRFDLDTRIMLEDFVFKVKPDKVPDGTLKKLRNILQLIQQDPYPKRSSATNSGKNTQSGKDAQSGKNTQSDFSSSSGRRRRSSSEDETSRPTKEILLSDSINESELSSPEIMRSCNEDVITVPDISIQSSDDLKCHEVLEHGEEDAADTTKRDKESSDKVVAVDADVTTTSDLDITTSSPSSNDGTDGSTAGVVLKQGRRYVTEILSRFPRLFSEKDLYSLREFVFYTGGNVHAMKMYATVAGIIIEKYKIKLYQILGYLYKTHTEPSGKAEDQNERCALASITELQRFMIHFLTNPRFCSKFMSMSVNDRFNLKTFINQTVSGQARAMEMFETICAILVRYGIKSIGIKSREGFILPRMVWYGREPCNPSSIGARDDSQPIADSNSKPAAIVVEDDIVADDVYAANLRRLMMQCLVSPKFCDKLTSDDRTFLKRFVNNDLLTSPDSIYYRAMQIFLTVSDALDGDRLKSVETPTASETPHTSDKTGNSETPHDTSDKTDSSSDKSSLSDGVSSKTKEQVSIVPRTYIATPSGGRYTTKTSKYPMIIVRKRNDDLKRLQSARKSVDHTNPLRLLSPVAVDMEETGALDSATVDSLKETTATFEYNEDPPCDIHKLQQALCCSAERLELIHPYFTSFGPCVSLCVGHLRQFMAMKVNGPVKRMKLTISDTGRNKLFKFCKRELNNRSLRNQCFPKIYAATQTTEDLGQHVANCTVLDGLDETSAKRIILDENVHAQAKIESLQQHRDKLKVKLSDYEQQLRAEKDLRKFLKTEIDRLTTANKQISAKAASDYELELEKLRRENQDLRLQLAQSPATQLKEENTTLQADLALLQTSSSSLQLNLDKKGDTIKSLEVSIQSISEALRHQTKTISALSRKHYDSLVDDHNHRIYSGYESLVTITCKILGAQQEVTKAEIEDPAKMREICESVAGDENLFSIFMRVFCGNSVCADETETAAIEKRVMFLINLMSYFYSGAGENEPSGSSLQQLL